MRKEALRYWEQVAAQDLASVRSAMLAGFRSEREFDESGRADAGHLLLPFVSRGDKVLDVGCGIGRLLKWVAPHCREAIGLDVSRGLLRIARRRVAGGANVRLARLPRSLAFPIAPGTIDFAYYYHVSIHVDREDNLRILGEIRRCLRPRGRALVQFSLLEHPDFRSDLARWARERGEAELAASYFTEPEVRIFLDLARLHPQIRLFIPGELVVVVTKRDDRVLGEMPLVRLHAEPAQRAAPGPRPRAGRQRSSAGAATRKLPRAGGSPSPPRASSAGRTARGTRRCSERARPVRSPRRH